MNKTLLYYLPMLGTYGLIILVALAGWELAEHSSWFANIWESKLNRGLIIFGLIGGLPLLLWYLYSYFWGERKFIRSFKNVARSQVADCKDNQIVRIQGEVVLLPECLLAPFSQRKCAAFLFVASEKVQRVDHRSITEEVWHPIKSIIESKDFLIQCNEHLALVRTENAQISIQSDLVHDESSYQRDSGGFLTKTENENRARSLNLIDINPKEYCGVYAEDIKFEEGVLEPGEQVAVMGTGAWIRTEDFEELKILHDQGVTRVFEFNAAEEQPLIVSDTKKLIDDPYVNYNFRQKYKNK